MNIVRVNLISHIKWFCILYSWDCLKDSFFFYHDSNQRHFYSSFYDRRDLDLKIGYSILEIQDIRRLEGCFPLEILGSIGSSLWVCGTYDKGSSRPFSVEPSEILPPFLPAPINTAMACLMPLLATLSLPRPVALWKRYSSFYVPLSLKWVYPYLSSGKLVRCHEHSRKCPSFVSIHPSALLLHTLWHPCFQITHTPWRAVSLFCF